MKTLRSLHGGSETGDVDFAKSINASIDIIEVNSELRAAWRRALDEALSDMPDEGRWARRFVDDCIAIRVLVAA
jgi:fructose/tagatose bisphosphate aldolase